MSRSRIAFLVAWGLLATGSVVHFVQSTPGAADDPAAFDDPAIWASSGASGSTCVDETRPWPCAESTDRRTSARP